MKKPQARVECEKLLDKIEQLHAQIPKLSAERKVLIKKFKQVAEPRTEDKIINHHDKINLKLVELGNLQNQVMLRYEIIFNKIYEGGQK